MIALKLMEMLWMQRKVPKVVLHHPETDLNLAAVRLCHENIHTRDHVAVRYHLAIDQNLVHDHTAILHRRSTARYQSPRFVHHLKRLEAEVGNAEVAVDHIKVVRIEVAVGR